MKAIFAAFAASLLALSSPASAQAPGGAEARLKSLNITLPPDAAPAANFVNSYRAASSCSCRATPQALRGWARASSARSSLWSRAERRRGKLASSC